MKKGIAIMEKRSGQKPLVSLMLLSYAHEKYILDCLESALCQDYSNMEIIYLDDHSPDATFTKALSKKAELENKFERVVMLCNEQNNGIVRNLNKMLKLAQGKYIKIMATDDFLLEGAITRYVDEMEKHPEYDMIYANGLIGGADVSFPLDRELSYQKVYESRQPSGSGMMAALYENDHIAAPGIMMRGETYQKLGAYDEEIGTEDWEYILRVAKDGVIGYLDKEVFLYRIVESSMSHSSSPKKRINMKMSELKILEKYQSDVKNSKDRMYRGFNEGLSDAFHINDREYLDYLYRYAKRNQVGISFRNRLKAILYRLHLVDEH